VPTLRGEGGLEAGPEGVPQVGEPQEKELCAGPPAALDYVDGSGGGGAVLPGGLRVGSPVTACHQHTHTQNVQSHFSRCQLLCRHIWAMRGLRRLETNERLNPIKDGGGGLKVPAYCLYAF
jgi:hypothetical protein